MVVYLHSSTRERGTKAAHVCGQMLFTHTASNLDTLGESSACTHIQPLVPPGPRHAPGRSTWQLSERRACRASMGTDVPNVSYYTTTYLGGAALYWRGQRRGQVALERCGGGLLPWWAETRHTLACPVR